MLKTQMVAAALILLQISGCALTKSDGGVYYEAAFNDHNPAPKLFSPTTVLDEDKQSIDPVYMRTKADFHFARGEAFSLEGKSQAAIQDFKSALIYDNNTPSLYLRTATEYLKAGQVKESVTFAQQAINKEPKYIEARVLLGSIYSAMRLYDKAIEQYEFVLKLEPSSAEARLYLGAVYSELKDYKKAIKHFESLLKLQDYSTPHLAYYYLGRVFNESKDVKSQALAIKHLQKAIELKPDFTDAVLSLGSIIAKSKDSKAMINLYSAHQRKHGGQLKIAEVLSQHYIEVGDYDSAAEQLEIIEAQSDEPLNAKLKLGLILVEKKMFSRAIEKLQEILKEVPESDKVHFYLGAVYEEVKENQNAIFHYKQVVPSSSFYGDAALHAAMLSKQNSKNDEAITILKDATEKRVTNPSIYIYYASLLDEKNQMKQAFETMQLAVQLFPDHAQSYFYLGTLLDKKGDKEATLLKMEKTIELEEDHVQALNYLAFTLAELNRDLVKAEVLAKKASKLAPKDGYVLDTLGWIYFKQGKVANAISILEKAFKLQPDVSIIAEHLAEAYAKNQSLSKANEMFNRAAELEADSVKSAALKARVTTTEAQQVITSDRQPAALQPDAP